MSRAGRVIQPPAASVIVINYNYARFLPAAIESALAQSYPNTEVVVIDDGSTDDSRQVIAGYGDRVSAVLKENGGHTSAFNAGFAASRGEIVCFLDADDLLLPTALEQAASRLLDDPCIVKVHWPLWVIDEQGRRTGEIEPSRPLEGGDLRELAIREGPAVYKSAPTSGNAYSRTFLEKVFPLRRRSIDMQRTATSKRWPRSTAPSRHYWSLTAAIEYMVLTSFTFGHSCRRPRPCERFECRARALSRHLREMGVEVHGGSGRSRRLLPLDGGPRGRTSGLDRIVPPGTRFILIDQGEWGTEQLVEGRTAPPFGGPDGSYGGPPEDDDSAVQVVKRLRRQGASYIVFWRDAFWWLDQYPAGALPRRHSRPRPT